MRQSVTDNERIGRAKNLLSRFTDLVNAYDPSAYEMFADDAVVTSTRRGMLTLRWSGKRFRELIGPSVDAARSDGAKVVIQDLQFQVVGSDVHIKGTSLRTPSNLQLPFVAAAGPAADGRWLFKAAHDGVPVKSQLDANGVRVELADQTAAPF